MYMFEKTMPEGTSSDAKAGAIYLTPVCKIAFNWRWIWLSEIKHIYFADFIAHSAKLSNVWTVRLL